MNLHFYQNLRSILMLGCIALLTSSLYSCKKTEENTVSLGQTLVNVNLAGVEAYGGEEDEEETNSTLSSKRQASVASASSATVQEMTVPFGDGCSIDVVMTNSPISTSQSNVAAPAGARLAATAQPQKALGPNVRYKVVVYDNQGNYVTDKTYSYGAESTTAGMILDAGKTYTFVAYSINSTSSLPSITNQNKLSTASLDNISGDLMYSATVLKLKEGTNNLSVVLKHRFSQITTTFTMDPNMTGAITKIENAVFKPTHNSANLKLAGEALSYNGLNTAGVKAIFPTLGTGLRTVIGQPALLIHPAVNNGTLNLGTFSIDGEDRANVQIPNVRIKPGQKYDLKLNFKTCTRDVTSSAMDWSYAEVIRWGQVGIVKDGTFYRSGSVIDRSFTAPGADYGFVFDITELDNAFNMEANGVKLAKQEIQFEVGASSTQNIQFADGSKYQGKDVETGKNIEPIYNMKGTAAAPLVKLVISRTGQVTMFGSKVSGGKLYPLVLTGTNAFNTFPWNGTQNNTVKATQLVDGRTILKAVGSGKKKIPCS